MHLVGLHAPPGVDLVRLEARLRERQVYASLRGDALRVSPHVYNDASDVGALLEVLRDTVK